MHSQALLSWLIWLPIGGGLLTLLVGDSRAQAARWCALVVSLATLALCVPKEKHVGGIAECGEDPEQHANLVIAAESRPSLSDQQPEPDEREQQADKKLPA